MLGYPLNWNMSRDIMKNDLEFFEDRISSDTPAMTYGFMAVAWKFAEDRSKMETAFEKSYADYMKQPFKVSFGLQGHRQKLTACTSSCFVFKNIFRFFDCL